VSTPTLESLDTPAKPAKRTSAPVAGSVSHSGDPEVRLAFSDESWVEVRDASGRVVFSDLGQPGQERIVKGQAPFQVVVGKSSGVSLTYNSRAVDLAPYTQAEVARLTLQ
jgi:cytoskeleton protein RodZ